MTQTNKIIIPVILLLFLISGFAGLVYEIVWTRIFGLVFGNTTLAISTVLAAFMSGLGLGSLIIGKISARLKNHLKAYAYLELGIAITALLVPLLQNPIESFFALCYARLSPFPFWFHLLQFFIAFLVMFPATFLMGGTLPMISHVIIRRQQRLGLGMGQLYGINTLGAMIGCFFTGFILIRSLGISTTIYLAVGLNLFIYIVAFLLQKSAMKIHDEKTPEPVAPRDVSPAVSLPGFQPILIYWIMAVSGFAALSYEVLWSRVLVFVMTNSVFAFSVMLTTFLGGIAIGSYFGGKMADRAKNAIPLLGWIEIIIGVAALVTTVILVNLSGIHSSIFSIRPTTTWWQWNGVRFLEAFLVMFLPTFFMGASFPVAVKIVVTQLDRMGARIGAVYFYNTIGGVIGSFLTGFVLIRLIGTSATLVGMMLINILVGIYVIALRRTALFKGFKYSLPILAVAMLVLALKITPRTLFSVAYSHVEKELKLIDFREGVEGTATVHELERPFEKIKRIDVDGLNVAGTSFMLQTLQKLQGHLPLFVKRNASRVLQIGFGTGQTSNSALLHPIRKFEVVEISRDVIDLADLHFQPLNNGVTRHPKFNYFILDGKNFVKYSHQKYDVIMNDANYAVATASASLFTRDHFENCKEKLTPGGILSTWMTIDLDPVDFQIVLKTFQSVFPYCSLWMAPNCINKQVVLMGSTQPWQIDFQRCRRLFANPKIKDDLAAININSVYDLLDCLVLDRHGIEAIAGDVPINTDNHPILEFSTRAVRSRDLCSYLNIGKIITQRPDLKASVTNLPADPQERRRVEQKLNQHFAATTMLLRGMLESYQGNTRTALETLLQGSRMIPDSRLAAYYFEKTDLITSQLIIDAAQHPKNLASQLNLVRHRISLSQYDAALDDLRRISRLFFEHPLVNYEIGRCYLGKAQFDSAKIFIEKSLQANPHLAASWYFLGEIERQQGQADPAIKHILKALQLDPRMHEAFNTLATIYQNRQQYRSAIDWFQKSLSIMAYQPKVMSLVGDCYFHSGDMKQAIFYYQRSLSLGLIRAQTFFRLANCFYLTKNFKSAVHYFKRAIALDSTNAEFYYNLGNSLVMQNNFTEAIAAFQQAIRLNDDQADYFNNLAMSYQQLGDTVQARKIFSRGLQLHPDSKLLKQNLARITQENRKGKK